MSSTEIEAVEYSVREDRMGEVVTVRAPEGTSDGRMRRAARRRGSRQWIHSYKSRERVEDGYRYVTFELSNIEIYRGSH